MDDDDNFDDKDVLIDEDGDIEEGEDPLLNGFSEVGEGLEPETDF